MSRLLADYIPLLNHGCSVKLKINQEIPLLNRDEQLYDHQRTMRRPRGDVEALPQIAQNATHAMLSSRRTSDS